MKAELSVCYMVLLGSVLLSARGPCGCRPVFDFCANDYDTYHSICEYKCKHPSTPFEDWFILYHGPCDNMQLLHYTTEVPVYTTAARTTTSGKRTGESPDEILTCYYSTSASYRPSQGKFEVTNIPTDLCTHIVYSFAGIANDNSGNVVSLDPHLDYAENGGKDYLRKFNALKKTNPRLKTILAVGGYGEGSKKYSVMANNPKLRRNFITSSISMLSKYGFDGLELVWQYPNRRDSVYGQADIQNFSELVKELREEFGKRGLLLAAAVGAVEELAKYSYNIATITSYLDWVSILSFDMNGPWDGVTGHNAPLYKGEGDEASSQNSIDMAVQYWLKQGCPPEKLVLGLPFYGRTFLLPPHADIYVRAPTVGPGFSGRYSQSEGFAGYNELCQIFPAVNWGIYRDSEAQAVYAVSDYSVGRNWISYDNPESLAAKVQYGLQHGIAGFMVKSIDTDDFLGACGNGDFPLLRSVNKLLGRI